MSFILQNFSWLHELICVWFLDYIRCLVNIHYYLHFKIYQHLLILPSENMSFGNKKKCKKSLPAISFHSHTLGSVSTLFAASTSSIRLSGRPPASGSCSRWNKGVWGLGTRAIGAQRKCPGQSLGQEPGSVPSLGLRMVDNRTEAQRKLGEGVKSCRNPKKGCKRHTSYQGWSGSTRPGSRDWGRWSKRKGSLPGDPTAQARTASGQMRNTQVQASPISCCRKEAGDGWGELWVGGGSPIICVVLGQYPSLNLSFPHLHPLGFWSRSGKANGLVIAPRGCRKDQVAGM